MAIIDVFYYGQLYPFNSILYTTFGWLSFDIESETVTNFDERARELLLEQFHNKPIIDSILQAYINVFQDLEFKLNDLQKLTRLETCSGVQLDNIAQYVNMQRNGMSDGDFRTAIKTRIVFNQSNGEIESIISAAKYLSGSNSVVVQDTYPAKIYIKMAGSTPTPYIKSQLKSITAAGIGIFIYHVPDNYRPLGFVQEGDIEPLYTGKFKEINVDTSNTDGIFCDIF